MEQVGKVLKVNDDTAEVQVQRISACGGDCGKCSRCDSIQLLVSAKNDIQAQVGQLVILDSVTKNILTAAMMIYIVPIIIFITGYIVTYSYIISTSLLVNAQTVAMFIGVCLFIIVFLAICNVDKKLQQSKRLELRITRIMQ